MSGFVQTSKHISEPNNTDDPTTHTTERASSDEHQEDAQQEHDDQEVERCDGQRKREGRLGTRANTTRMDRK